MLRSGRLRLAQNSEIFTKLGQLFQPRFRSMADRETQMKTVTSGVLLSILAAIYSCPTVAAQDRSLRENPELAAFFEDEVSKLEKQNELTRFTSLAEWQEAKPKLREQLFDMLGLSPRPEKTPLQAETSGAIEEADFVVERVHFQSMPGLYVTGNFYRPKSFEGPLPTILYVCGHGQVKKDGISFGNKTHYHYHGSWFARNGYACLTIDTLQLGEIEGIHHGTYKMNRWWWNSRGYTPAGVEAWNCIRALDYLETRPEVDATRIGVTGRSGGGAYSWWIAALDERIRCAVPVAGITSLRDHVINGCVEGHCDCMYMVNTFRWDYATVAALVAPRPLLISNTDKDTIFPLEGVVDIHRQVRHIYHLYDAGKNLGLQITEGPHADTQELHIHAFRWFNRFLRNDTSMIEKTAVKFFDPEQLKVFEHLPTDEINTRIDETFVPLAQIPATEDVLKEQDAWFNGRLAQLRERCFRAWPDNDPEWKPPTEIRIENLPIEELKLDLDIGTVLQRQRIHFLSQSHVPLYIDVLLRKSESLSTIRSVRLVLSSDPVKTIQHQTRGSFEPLFVFSPRGMGDQKWAGNDAKQIQIERRFQLIGTTTDTMRIWDIRRAVKTIRETCRALDPPVLVSSEHDSRLEKMILLASLFEAPEGARLIDPQVVDSNEWPTVLNLSRSITPQELIAMISWRTTIILPVGAQTKDGLLEFAMELSKDKRWRGKEIQSFIGIASPPQEK
jgi:dienelactone hydrolase